MAGAVVAGGAYFSSPDLAEFNLFYYRSINSGSKGIYFTIQSTTITSVFCIFVIIEISLHSSHTTFFVENILFECN